MRDQAGTLARARVALAVNKPTIDALAASVAGVASISATVATITRESIRQFVDDKSFKPGLGAYHVGKRRA